MRRRFQSTPSGGKATARSIEQPLHRGFQSTPSGGKATRSRDVDQMDFCVSIHAFRGEGDIIAVCAKGASCVSIHAFRGEGDGWVIGVRALGNVSIHAFRGEGDVFAAEFASSLYSFNPRLPGGRRPDPYTVLSRCVASFNPRLPGGRRPDTTRLCHAASEFQSTPSGGKATFAYLCASLPSEVSIHAFRGEGDGARP